MKKLLGKTTIILNYQQLNSTLNTEKTIQLLRLIKFVQYELKSSKNIQNYGKICLKIVQKINELYKAKKTELLCIYFEKF